jgi:hypothetical protein
MEDPLADRMKALEAVEAGRRFDHVTNAEAEVFEGAEPIVRA